MTLPIPSRYFVTGATGALGREVLARILRDEPDAEVTLLVRGQGDACAAARGEGVSEARLEELLRYLDAYAGLPRRLRLRIAVGDARLPRFGLPREEYEALAHRVTHVIHCAAGVKFNETLAEARRINVGGTRAALAFARRCRRLVRLAHVSTAYVAGDRAGLIREHELACGQGFYNSYERSKYEAELLVRSQQGSLPVTIFRPSIIVGDSRDGHLSCFSTIYRPLRAIAAGVAGPLPGDAEARLDVVPVDYVAEAIARLTRRPARGSATYHVTAGPDRTVAVRELIEIARQAFGRRAPHAPPRAGGAEPETLMPFAGYLTGDKRFDDSYLRADLDGSLPPCPAPASYLRRALDHYRDTHWGARRPWVEQNPLQAGAR